MSVKFEKETIKVTEAASTAAAGVVGGKDNLMAHVSQTMKKGGGAQGYLAVSSAQLHSRQPDY